jgi:pimeloyl-ACP methyl ester carboxylesterase
MGAAQSQEFLVDAGETKHVDVASGAAAGRVAYHVIDGTGGPPAKGAGATFVCVPGLGDVRAEYRRLAPLLAAEPGVRRVVIADLRGMGGSEPSFGAGAYTPHATGEDILSVLRAEGVGADEKGSTILVGCSMSAASCVAAAKETKPEGRNVVSGVVLLSPFLWDRPMPFGVAGLLKGLMGNNITGPSFWTSYYSSLYTNKTSEGPVPDLPSYVASLKRNIAADPRRCSVVLEHMLASKGTCEAAIPSLGERKLPVLSVFGSDDKDFAKELGGVRGEGDALVARLRKGYTEDAARLVEPAVIVDCAGHYPHVEAPIAVAAAIVEWGRRQGLM